MKLQPSEQRVWDLIAAPVEDLGVRLVRVRLSGSEHQVLQLMIEPMATNRDNRPAVTVEQCAQVSRMVSALMDVHDPIPSAYTLEVSSTGADRPLMSLEDCAAYAPHRVKLQLEAAMDGLRRFTCMLQEVDGEELVVKVDDRDEPLRIPFAQVRSAKLAYTPEELDKFYGLAG